MNKLNDFYTYLETEKRYSLNTINSYKRDLSYFSNYIKREQIDNIDELAIKNYLAHLYVNNYKKKTIARKLSSIRSYYTFLNKKHNCNYDFIKNIKNPKKDRLLPQLIYKDELEKILNYNHTGLFPLRDKAIIHLLYSSGLRVSELCSITLSSINLEDRYVLITGKGNKTRLCPFSNSCKSIIEQYMIKERNNRTTSECLNLFINKYGNKISTRAIQMIINEISMKLFNTQKIHPHLFRHTYATNLLNNGADLRVVQELLGHSSLYATQVYTHLAKEQINNIYKVSHPRSQ